jgi:hypothetical protein
MSVPFLTAEAFQRQQQVRKSSIYLKIGILPAQETGTGKCMQESQLLCSHFNLIE